jgi:DNA-binding transcriptional LysR family regulator
MLNEMKYVYEVYKEKSFSKAAKKLFISQPALSNMVRKAEKEMGAPIFDRSTIPLTVTKEGAYYIRTVEKILFLERNLERYFQDIAGLQHAGARRCILFLLVCVSGSDCPFSDKISAGYD